MAHSTLPSLTHPEFPQVFNSAIDQQVEQVGRICQRIEVYPRPDQTLRMRNRKIASIIGKLHASYLAAQLLGLPELASYYRAGYMEMMAHWGRVTPIKGVDLD